MLSPARSPPTTADRAKAQRTSSRAPTLIKIIALLGVLCIGLTAVGCATTTGAGKKAANAVRSQDVTDINQQVIELRHVEPLPHFKDSAALHVQNAYYTADADPNKIWYVTIVGMNGSVLEHFTTKGAPQPAGDQVTNPVQQICAGGSQGEKNCDTIGLPEPNGVHQSADADGYVSILTTGAMKRFTCAAVYCDISDQPVSIKSAVALVINETAAISATDESKTTNGIVPTGTSTRAK